MVFLSQRISQPRLLIQPFRRSLLLPEATLLMSGSLRDSVLLEVVDIVLRL